MHLTPAGKLRDRLLPLRRVLDKRSLKDGAVLHAVPADLLLLSIPIPEQKSTLAPWTNLWVHLAALRSLHQIAQ